MQHHNIQSTLLYLPALHKEVYPDVIKKELVVFKEQFKDELALENVNVDINNIGN